MKEKGNKKIVIIHGPKSTRSPLGHAAPPSISKKLSPWKMYLFKVFHPP